jgi:hypothetical protein
MHMLYRYLCLGILLVGSGMLKAHEAPKSVSDGAELEKRVARLEQILSAFQQAVRLLNPDELVIKEHACYAQAYWARISNHNEVPGGVFLGKGATKTEAEYNALKQCPNDTSKKCRIVKCD